MVFGVVVDKEKAGALEMLPIEEVVLRVDAKGGTVAVEVTAAVTAGVVIEKPEDELAVEVDAPKLKEGDDVGAVFVVPVAANDGN